VYNASNLIMVH